MTMAQPSIPPPSLPTGPLLYLQAPDGPLSRIDISDLLVQEGDTFRLRIGRDPSMQIPLEDPQRNISRMHCVIEYISRPEDQENGEKRYKWEIRDPGSANGTYLKRAADSAPNTLPLDLRTCDRAVLQDQDQILILALMLPRTDVLDDPELYPAFYTLTFQDPQKTVPRAGFATPNGGKALVTGAEYHLSARHFYLLHQDDRTLVSLPPQEQRFLHCVAQYTQDHGAEKICTYEHLIKTIWGSNPIGATINQVHHIAWRIKAKIELDSGEPRFLHNVRGQGYRLAVILVP